MKIRSRWVYQLVGILGAWIIRLWMGSLRYRVRKAQRAVDPCDAGFEGRYIYAFWHECMLYPAYLYAIPDVKVLISRHSDGEFISQVVSRLGFGVVRGSTNRQGAEALMAMIRHARDDGHLAITPDGPRGPRRHLQMGVVYLASRTGLAIVPVGFASDRPWRGTNWDAFQLPRPGSVATVVAGEPIRVPPDVEGPALESWRQRIQTALNEATEEAERWAEQESRLAIGPLVRPIQPGSRIRANARAPRAAQRWRRSVAHHRRDKLKTATARVVTGDSAPGLEPPASTTGVDAM